MNNREIKYCVFFKPKNNILNTIIKYKNVNKHLEEIENYFNHPPHLTFYLFQSAINEEKIISKFKNLRFKKLSIDFDGWKIFENDQNSNKDTVVLSFKTNEEIKKLQMSIVNSLNSFRTSKISYNNKWGGLYKESYLKWGYPFIGSHWIPHFTIGSFSQKNKFYLNELISKKNHFSNVLIEELFLCRVNKNEHISICNIKLDET
jgi:hypothetical protein